MAEQRLCSKCGAPLAADAPAGVCPQCVLKLGLEGSVHVSVIEPSSPESRPTPRSSQDPGPTTPGSTGFTPPTVEELQKHFPQMEILELLGRGGMGAVYKARQPALDRLVALKILPPEVGRDPQFAERFTREARALAKLSHPNIVMVYEFGQSDGLYFLIMEFVDGVNLRQTIRGGALTSAEALKIVPQICEALQFAHEEGVVHRDIKPENILLDKRGRLKIADFGLAKLLGRTDSAVLLTQTYQVMGTLHYMAPEQFERPTAVDHRADIYSLGVVFYELLTGHLPLGRFALPSETARIDARLDDVVLKTLEREPDRRYQHASDVKTDIESIGQLGQFTRAPATAPATPRPRAVASQSASTEVSAADWESARRKVQGPAIGLMLVGALNLLPCVLLLLALLAPLAWLSHRWPSPDRSYGLLDNEVQSVAVLSKIAISIARADYGAAAFAFLAWQEMPPQAVQSFAGFGVMEVVVLLPLLLLSLPLGILMMIGGYKMRRLELYGLVLIAAIVALIPCSPSFLLSMPIGIWALVVLLNADVKAAFGHKPVVAEVIPEKKPPLAPIIPPLPGEEETLTSSSGQTTGPGIALIVVGVVAGLFWCAAFLSLAIGELGDVLAGVDKFSPGNSGIAGMSIGFAAALAAALTVVYGGLKMRARTSYRWAMAASVLAMVPFSPACLLGLWVGLWSFFTLQSSSVKRAFEAVRRRSPPSSLASALPALALILVPPLLVVVTGFGLSVAARAQQPEPVGTILVYDVQVPSVEQFRSPSDSLEFFESRVNTGKRKVAQLKISDQRHHETGSCRIEIGVFGSDPVVANRIEERLQATGKIEFAMLADPEIDAKVVGRAKATPGMEVPPEDVKAENGGAPISSVARWVKLLPRAESQLRDAFGEYRQYVTRRNAEGGMEALVLIDPLNVTDKEMSQARVEMGQAGSEASVSLAFNSEGAKKMRTLTSRPESLSTPFKTRRLAILVDDAVFTAPKLNEIIADQLQITGDFTRDEAHDFVAIVRAGRPPGTIKQVSRKSVVK